MWSELTFQKCINKTACMTNHHLSSESCLKQSHALSKLSVIDHHSKSSSFIVQLGLQIENCGWGRGRWEQLQDCQRIGHQWIHGSSLAKRSSEPLQWRAENVSKTKDDGLLCAEVSWIGSNTSGVVFRAKKSGKFFVLNQNQLIPVISIELPCLLKRWEQPLVIGQFPMLSKQWFKNIATRFVFYRNCS